MQNGDYAKEIFSQIAELKVEVVGLKHDVGELKRGLAGLSGRVDALSVRFDQINRHTEALREMGKHMAAALEQSSLVMRETLAQVGRVDTRCDLMDRRLCGLEYPQRRGD